MIHEEGFNAEIHKGYILVKEKREKKLVVNPETFPRELRKARKKANMDRKELAAKIGVNENTVYEWEVGRRLPRAYNLDELRKVLDIHDN